MTTDDIAKLKQLEAARCKALMAADGDTLAGMLAENLVHIHLTGVTDTKAGYLDGFHNKYTFRNIDRGPLTVRVFGDAAVMTGTLTQKLEIRASGEVWDVQAMTTQVWNRTANGWLLNTCHNAPLQKV